MTDIESCHACGALPCDWVSEPRAAAPAPSPVTAEQVARIISDAKERFIDIDTATNQILAMTTPKVAVTEAARSMTFDEVEDLHSRISGVITAQERFVWDEQHKWDRLMEARTSLAEWLEAQRPELSYAGGSWPKSAALSTAPKGEG